MFYRPKLWILIGDQVTVCVSAWDTQRNNTFSFVAEINLNCMHRQIGAKTGVQCTGKKSYEANYIRHILLFHAGWKDPTWGIWGEKTFHMKTSTLSAEKKKRMTVHYKSWFIAGSWKYSRKKSWKIITHACEIGNKYYLKGLLTHITVLSKLRPHSEMMRPFLATRCCCRHLSFNCFSIRSTLLIKPKF